MRMSVTELTDSCKLRLCVYLCLWASLRIHTSLRLCLSFYISECVCGAPRFIGVEASILFGPSYGRGKLPRLWAFLPLTTPYGAERRQRATKIAERNVYGLVAPCIWRMD